MIGSGTGALKKSFTCTQRCSEESVAATTSLLALNDAGLDVKASVVDVPIERKIKAKQQSWNESLTMVDSSLAVMTAIRCSLLAGVFSKDRAMKV